ncbi:LysR family transcriptional regulator [Dinoroseobacter sp. S76]|uniref:LysR family transcriptional regulator n=1 Tax=Dinoroseobacter sp. S76 TaxID=3415124 RepID=UPI003C7BC50C
MAFLKTVELGSIRAAARALGQDPTGISRRITQLETRLGAKLVDRSGAATRATAQGQLYFDRLKGILDQLDALEAEIGGETLHPSGLLRVTAAIDFGQEFLAPWLVAFRDAHPDVEFDLVLASGFVDLSQNNIDVAVRAGCLPDSSLVARKLADVPRVTVASPDYVARRGMPRKPEDLAAHDFVFFSPANRAQPLELTGPDGAVVRVPRRRGVAINAVRSVVTAVQAGQGVHTGPRWAFAKQLASGAVLELLPEYKAPGLPLYAVRQASVVVPARITHFIDFLQARVQEVDGLLPVRPTVP